MATIVTARLRVKNKQYEIRVDLDEALKVKAKKPANLLGALETPHVWTNVKEGNKASESDLKAAFGTSDLSEVAAKIITSGEIEKPQEFRDAEREMKIKRVLDIILKNAVDQHGRPYTADRIKRAIDEVHFSFDNRAPEQQVPELLEKLKTVIPIKIETKRVKLIIPAQYTGQVYGILKDYKESEEWLSNGNLQVILNIPAGMQLDFYDKLNNITHGSVQSEELAEKK